MKKNLNVILFVIIILLTISIIIISIEWHKCLYGQCKSQCTTDNPHTKTKNIGGLLAPPPGNIQTDAFNDFMPYVYFDDFDGSGDDNVIEVAVNIPTGYSVGTPDGPISCHSEPVSGGITQNIYSITVYQLPGEPATIYTASINTGISPTTIGTGLTDIAIVVRDSVIDNDTLGRTIIHHAQNTDIGFELKDVAMKGVPKKGKPCQFNYTCGIHHESFGRVHVGHLMGHTPKGYK